MRMYFSAVADADMEIVSNSKNVCESVHMFNISPFLLKKKAFFDEIE